MWTDDQLAAYERALVTIGDIIATKAREVEEEKAKMPPNRRRIDALRHQQARLIHARQQLRLEVRDAIVRASEQYGGGMRAPT
ncbi:hypothetical protein L3V59_36290 [Burkholderia aenigmatica]|uniref:hypothetical protein n=1 Tax=Burkholderia aenigmatica TaxID=2015348 RepID=UPI001F34785B|nr:hypothetical protein [Burkholderia aenigmatica]UKD17406.1 hypothetical protein L3V59_36290 [Burkholderia aenigmatica]